LGVLAGGHAPAFNGQTHTIGDAASVSVNDYCITAFRVTDTTVKRTHFVAGEYIQYGLAVKYPYCFNDIDGIGG
jgi:hypothetical protein